MGAMKRPTLCTKKNPLIHSPSVRMPTAVYQGAAARITPQIIATGRRAESASPTAGRVTRAILIGSSPPVGAARSRRSTASHQAQGASTASGPTNPIGPLQTTARPSARPAASAVAIRIRVSFPSVPGLIASATISVAQAVSAVRLASGVAACASIETRRQPT